MKKALLIFLTLAMLLSLCACETPDPPKQDDIQYAFEDVICNLKENGEYIAEAVFLLESKDVETLKTMVNGAAWQPGCLNRNANYMFIAGETVFHLILDEFCINDQTNDRHFMLSEEQKEVMQQRLIPYFSQLESEIETPEYIFEDNFECTRKAIKDDVDELSFSMLKEDVQAINEILVNGERGFGQQTIVPDYVFNWPKENVAIYYDANSCYVNVDVVDKVGSHDSYYVISAMQQKQINDILAKYPLDLLPGQEGVISYGSAQCELPSAGIDLLCGVVNGAVWTLGEPKAVCSYKITLDGRELEYSPEGILCDSANGRYTLVSLNQKNKINALIELLIGTIDTTLPPT